MYVHKCGSPFSLAPPLHQNHSHHLDETRKHTILLISVQDASLTRVSKKNELHNKAQCLCAMCTCCIRDGRRFYLSVSTLGIFRRFGQGLGLIHIPTNGDRQVLV